MGRDFRRLASDRNLPQSHQPRDQGTAGKGRSQHGTDPPKRRWAQANGEQGCQPAGGLGTVGEPVTRGDPESPLRWTCKSIRKLAKELSQQGHQVSHQLVSELLHELGYSLQANRKTNEGGDHPDRDAQFEHVNAQAEAFLAAGEPVVSVDAKKKELVGDFRKSRARMAAAREA